MRPPDLGEGRDHHYPRQPQILKEAVPGKVRESGVTVDLIEDPVEGVGIVEGELAGQPAGGESFVEPLHVPEQKRAQPGRPNRLGQPADERRGFGRDLIVLGDGGSDPARLLERPEGRAGDRLGQAGMGGRQPFGDGGEPVTIGFQPAPGGEELLGRDRRNGRFQVQIHGPPHSGQCLPPCYP